MTPMERLEDDPRLPLAVMPPDSPGRPIGLKRRGRLRLPVTLITGCERVLLGFMRVLAEMAVLGRLWEELEGRSARYWRPI
jgi:hypothetical protein